MRSMDRREFMKVSAGTAAVLAGSRWLGAEPQAAAPVVLPPPEGRPRKSVLFQMLPEKLSYEERFAMAKRVGFEGVEVPPMGGDLEAARKLREAAEKAGIPIHSVIFGGWNPPLSDPDPAVREKALGELQAGLKYAKAVGADNLLLVPGVVTEKVRYAEAYERSQEGIRKALPLAEELKVVVSVEEVWNNFLLSPMEFVRYVDEFQSPFLKAYFDVGNIVKNGWPEDWIRTLGKRINRIHLKDFKRSTREWTPLLEGEVNWKEVRKALAEIGYVNYMTTELGGGDEAYLKDVSQRVDKIIAG